MKPWNKGLKLSEKIREKISKKLTGRKITEIHKINIGKANKNKIVSEKTKEKVRGENCILWKGGFFKRNEVSFEQSKYLLEGFHEIRNSNNILEVKCTYCSKWYKPTWIEINNRIKSLHYQGDGGRNLYCSNSCKQECPTYRQRKYPKGYKISTSREVQSELRKLVFEKDNWLCVKCGADESLQCHHIDPVVNNPIESADINNCITLCKECHRESHKKDGCKYGELKC